MIKKYLKFLETVLSTRCYISFSEDTNLDAFLSKPV